MFVLLSLSPRTLDQSFPRSKEDLECASVCLGELITLSQSGKIKILFTNLTGEFINDIQWEQHENVPLLSDIQRALALLFLSNGVLSVICDVQNDGNSTLHPLPNNCCANGNAEIWQEEMGIIFSIHQHHVKNGSNYIGIACDQAFAGYALSEYPPEAVGFPIVGPQYISDIKEFESYEVHQNDIGESISYASAKKNLHVIGGKVEKAKGTSHHRVTFRDAPRPWVLDKNDDPVPDAYLKQIVPLSGLREDVIRFALLHGRMPPIRRVLPL